MSNKRPLQVLNSHDLMIRTAASINMDDRISLAECIKEIESRENIGDKMKKLLDYAKNYLKENPLAENSSECESSLEADTPLTNVTASGLGLDSIQTKNFLGLIAGFVMLDKNFCDKEKDYLEALLEREAIAKENFDEALAVAKKADPRIFCESKISQLNNLSNTQQTEILSVLNDLSLTDSFLHVEEKGILEGIKRHWGVNVNFGKGDLPWTEEQKQVIESPINEKMIVNATAGSGKTAVACARISHLIDGGAEASSIWLLSFTRTAVQELKDRINNFAEDEEDTLGAKIATLDSRAWQMRRNFTEGPTAELFGGYDVNIDEAINTLEEKHEEFEEYFEDNLKHLIIDEAQDITGNRLVLINKLISLLPSSCGITIFGDRAQAIYGFTHDDDADEKTENGVENFLSFVIDNNNDQFKYIELDKIHRTNNKKLIELIDSLHLDILIDDEITPSIAKERIEEFAEKKNEKPANLENKTENTLVLFRRRADVLQAMGFAMQKGIVFRLRMSGLPIVVRPWIGQIFSRIKENIITKETFEKIFTEKSKELILCGDTEFSASKRLMDTVKKGENIDVAKLRRFLSLTTPPVDLCIPDLGTSGPVLGTIHASKGREAENVTLFLNDDHSKNSSKNKLDEETRVFFVGASRARSSLSVGPSFQAYAKKLENGRIFGGRKTRTGGIQVEFGRAKDFNNLSVVAEQNFNERSTIDAEALQLFLARKAKEGIKDVYATSDPDDNFTYYLYLKGNDDIPIGSFNRIVNDDLFQIKKVIGGGTKNGLCQKINHLKMVGLRTVAIGTEDPRVKTISPKYRETLIWNVPIIVGFPTIYL